MPYNFACADPANLPLIFGVEAPGTPGKADSPYAAQEPASIPSKVVDDWVAFLKGCGIKRTVCLLKSAELACYQEPGYAGGCQSAGLNPTCIDIFSDGAAAKLFAALDAAETADEKVAVHCSGGEGRTGLLLGSWLVHSKGMAAEDAAATVLAAAKEAGVARKCTPHKLDAFIKDGKATP